MRKLFLVVGIFAFGAVLVLSFLPRMVFAQTSGLTTIELLQKQIQDLLAVVQSLQKQVSELKSELGASAPIISSATSSISVIVSTTSIITSIISEEPASEVSELVLPTFTRQLSRGASGEDVRKLQEFFAQDKSLYPEGLITGYFGPATERAMKKWQEKNNLEAVGRIGPKSIMKLNELMTRGAGKSGIIPPGLLIAPRIQQKFGTSNFATTSIPIYPIYTTTTATTTVQYIYVYSTSTLATSTIATSTTYTTTTTYVYIPPTQTTQQTTTQTTTNTTTTTTNASTTATSTTATNPPIFTITSPNGGEQMTVGNTYTISWTSAGVSVSSVSIDLYKSGSYITHLIDKDNSGNFTWTIPSGLSSITTGSDYKIRIYNNMYYSNYDESNNAFTITVPVTAPSISPIGYWKFDGSGANEISGSPSATKVGNAVFNASGGKFNGYLYIPGSSDYAKIPYNSMFDLPDNFTIEFWFRQRTNQSFNQNLIYKGTPINNYNFNVSRWLWNEYNYGPVIAGHTTVNTGYWTQPSNPNQLAHNEWHHVAFTKNPTYHAYYLDGVLIGSKDVTATSEYGGPAKTPAVDIIIGDTAVDTDFDNIRIYNTALSRNEVLYNYAENVSVSAIIVATSTTATSTTTTSTPGVLAPEPSNDDSGVWAQVDIATGQIVSSSICTRSVCGINGEYHGYVPPSSWATGSVWWPTSKRYIWQMSGQAGYGSGTFDFNTYVFTVAGGTIYNGVFIATVNSTSTVPTSTSTATSTSFMLNSFQNQLANISVMVSRLSEEIKRLLNR